MLFNTDWVKCNIMMIVNKAKTVLSKFYYRRHGINCQIRENCFFKHISNVHIEDDAFINYGVQFYTDYAHIYIGHNVRIAPNVQFCCVTHEPGDGERRAGKDVAKDIHVCDGSWICIGSIILPGVTIGNGSVIAAGSVVNNDIPANEMWGGYQPIS